MSDDELCQLKNCSAPVGDPPRVRVVISGGIERCFCSFGHTILFLGWPNENDAADDRDEVTQTGITC